MTKLITKNLKKDLFGLMFKRVQSISIVKAWGGSWYFGSEGMGEFRAFQ